MWIDVVRKIYFTIKVVIQSKTPHQVTLVSRVNFRNSFCRLKIPIWNKKAKEGAGSSSEKSTSFKKSIALYSTENQGSQLK